MVEALAVAGAAALASLIKGTIGLGFPPVATPLVAAVVGAQTAVVSLAIPGFLQNAVQAWGGRSHLPGVRALVPLLVTLVAGTLAGAYLLTTLPVHLVTLLVGAVVIAYAVLAILRFDPVLPARWAGAIGAVVGLIAGVLGGATGIFAPLLALYLAALRLDKERFTATIAFVFFVAQVPQVVGYAALGLFSGHRLWLTVVMIPPVAIGFTVGTWIRSRISQGMFAAAVRWALLLIGIRLVLDALH